MLIDTVVLIPLVLYILTFSYCLFHQLNGCHGEPASFVYCNMNKHMKFSPDVFKHWLHILQSVPGSVLCLLRNPPQAEPNLRAFVGSIDDSLQDRIRYSEFIVNPYDNQQRVKENCNIVLDTPIYSGHTTNADALWAGVPIVTHGTSVDISGRVGQSMLSALGLPELVARDQVGRRCIHRYIYFINILIDFIDFVDFVDFIKLYILFYLFLFLFNR
jgi:hypothetical protein